MRIPKHDLLGRSFSSIDDVQSLYFIPLSHETALLEHEITGFFGAVNGEIGRSLAENCFGFPVGVYHSKELCVTFDGCLFTDKALIATDALNFREASRPVLEHFLAPELDEVFIEDPCILLYGPGWPTWGHWTIEFLARIFIASKIGLDVRSAQWIIPNECPDFARKLIKKIGILDENLIIFDHRTQYLRCKSIYVPTNLTCGMSCHPLMKDYIVWIRNLFGEGLTQTPDQRIYLSRQMLDSRRHVANTDEVENIFHDHGYKIIHPECLSIDDQISIYSKSLSLFSDYGSASHNSIFAHSQTFIGCLRGNRRSVGFVQSALSRAAGQKCCYIFGEHLTGHEHQSYRIDLCDLREALHFAEQKIKLS